MPCRVKNNFRSRISIFASVGDILITNIDNNSFSSSQTQKFLFLKYRWYIFYHMINDFNWKNVLWIYSENIKLNLTFSSVVYHYAFLDLKIDDVIIKKAIPGLNLTFSSVVYKCEFLYLKFDGVIIKEASPELNLTFSSVVYQYAFFRPELRWRHLRFKKQPGCSLIGLWVREGWIINVP